MAVRRPLVMVNGQLQELPIGDTLAGAGGSSTPTKVAPTGTFTVAADTQVLFAADIDVQGALDVSGTFIEVT